MTNILSDWLKKIRYENQKGVLFNGLLKDFDVVQNDALRIIFKKKSIR